MTQVETYRRFFKIPMTGTAIQGPFQFKKLQKRSGPSRQFPKFYIFLFLGNRNSGVNK